MAATGYTTGDPQKVDISGDAMTGELVLPDSSPDTALSAASRGYVDNATAAVTAASETRYVNVTGDTMTGRLNMTAGNTDVDVQQALSTAIGTGVIYGGEINKTPAVTGSFDVGLTVAYITNIVTDPTDPAVQTITIPAQTVPLDSGALSRVTTWILADSAGNIIQQGSAPTNTQRRTHVQLGLIAQLGGVIFVDQSIPVILNNPIGQLNDLMFALGAFNIVGNDFAGVAATLGLQKTVGKIFSVGANYYSGPTRTNDPHVSDIPAQNPVSIRYTTQAVGSLEAASTVIKPNTYDLNGVATTIGGVGTRSTIQRVFIAPANQVSDQVIIQYGQQFYGTLTEALATVGKEAFVLNPSIEVSQGVVYWGSLVIQRNATDTTLTNQVQFFPASKFGGGVSGAAGLSALAAYALLSGAAFTGNVSINAAVLSILGTAKGFRLRPTGSANDIEATGSDLLLSNWSGANFDGTQRSYDRYSADADNVQHAGQREWVDALYGVTRHVIEDNTGIAAWGSKNGLTNIRLAGFKNTAGAPTTQAWLAGDVVLDSAGAWHLCTASGTPGSWT